ncbi:MAG: hypothetical protein HFG99_09445 [Dorea sp.]|jgi:hypothetical protein|nr:hypothetical protein [Dorea sp.]MCI9249352.1 hypothetical protein [Dorea sp.]
MKRRINSMKLAMSNILGKTTVMLAMSAVFLTARDWPCLLFGGEPEIPDILVQKKKETYGGIGEDINM